MTNNRQNFENLPAELLALDRWIPYKYYPETNEKKPISNEWSKIENQSRYDQIDGIRGFVIGVDGTDGYFVLDADHVFNDGGQIVPEAEEKLNKVLSDIQPFIESTYWEFSISKTGFHAIGKWIDTGNEFPKLAAGKKATIPLTDKGLQGAKLEIWYKTAHGFIFTGNAKERKPIISNDLARLALQKLIKYLPKESNDPRSAAAGVITSDSIDDVKKQEILNALDYINPSSPNIGRPEWIYVGMALEHSGFNVDTWINWSKRDPARFHDGECEQQWKSFHGSTKPRTYKTIFQIAYDMGWSPLNLDLTDKGKIKNTIKNIATILTYDKIFFGNIGYNQFDHRVYLTGNVPWEHESNFRIWTDSDDAHALSILESKYGLGSEAKYLKALTIAADNNRFHPLRDLLRSCQYKGDGYIRRLLPDYLGCDDSDYNYQVMKFWMLGAVNRAFHDGCKFDHSLLLTGTQGIGKSTFLRFLALDDMFFNDSIGNMDTKDAIEALIGSWIIELGELSAMARTSGGVDSVKRFLTATQDNIRLSYAHRTEIYLRHCVFAGTTNKNEFLPDETGNRRFLIVETGKHDRKNLFTKEAMETIRAAWGEVMHIYDTENPQLVLPAEIAETAADMQNNHCTDDGMKGVILAYLEDQIAAGVTRVCVKQIWHDALGHRIEDTYQSYMSGKIGNIIINTGQWEKADSNSNARFKTKHGDPLGCQRFFRYIGATDQGKNAVGVAGFTPVVADDPPPFD